jgi:H+-transporting ATPase
MDENQIGTKVAQQTPTDELMRQLGATPQGLSNEEARQRLERFAANEITEKTTSPIIQFLGYLWGPIPWMIEAAAILSLVVHHWVDLGIIVTLLLFNAGVGFWQEYQAGNAVAALKKKLALKSRVLREGAWQPLNARELVPGDIIRLRAGDIIPADAKLIDGEYLSVDQSALTGESLPAGKEKDDVVYSGSIAKQGEMIALVTTTGAQTYFGRTARLVEGAGKASHFQKAVLQIGDTLIYLSLGLVAGAGHRSALSRIRFYGAASVCPDSHRGLDPGSHAGRAFSNHGRGRRGPFQNEGHCLPSGIGRGDGRDGYSLLGQNRHPHPEPPQPG